MYIYLSTNKYVHITTRILRPNTETFLTRMSALCGRILFANTEVTDLDSTFLYILILRTHTKFVCQILFSRKTNCYRSALASRNPFRVLADGMPLQDHV